MSKPAARIGDMHVCPMVTPGVPPIPHVGGPVTGPGVPTVLIGGKPAAVMGDMCVCTGPPDTIVLGSMGVLIGGKPAARMGDMCGHGGTIVLGQPNVLIGEMSPGAPGAPAMMANFLNQVKALPGGKAGALAARQAMTLSQAAVQGAPFCEMCQQDEEVLEDSVTTTDSEGTEESEDNAIEKKIERIYFADSEGNELTEIQDEEQVFLHVVGENISGEEVIVSLHDNPDEFTYNGSDIENNQLTLTASADQFNIELGIKMNSDQHA